MTLVSQLRKRLGEKYCKLNEDQCFVSHEFGDRDIRVRLANALEVSGLKPYFADRELTSETILDKICGKILATRAFIVDVSKLNPNVYFELGLAIGFNKPILAIAKEGCEMPSLLKDYISLQFSHYSELEQALSIKMPVWFTNAAETQTLYSSHCHFLNRPCDDRIRIAPGKAYYLIDETHAPDSFEQSMFSVNPDLNEAVLNALNRFQFNLTLFDQLPGGDDFRFCDICRASREAAFGIINISLNTTVNVNLFAGLYFSLGIDFLMLVQTPDKQGNDVVIPTLLQGFDYLPYRYFDELENKLPNNLEAFLDKIKTAPLIDRILEDLPTEEIETSKGKVLDWNWMDAKQGRANIHLLREHVEEMIVDGFPHVLAYIYIAKDPKVIDSAKGYIEYMLHNSFYNAHQTQVSLPKSFDNNQAVERAILAGLGITAVDQISDQFGTKTEEQDILSKCLWLRHNVVRGSRDIQLSIANYMVWTDTVLTSALPENGHVITQLFIQTQNPALFAASLGEILRTTHLAPKSVIRITHDIEDTGKENPYEYWMDLLDMEQGCG